MTATADGPGTGRIRGRVGVFGGTFDPPHVGHLSAAAEVGWSLQLDTVLLVVANDPWQKTADRSVTPADDRWAMVLAATEGVDGVVACDLELRRGGPSYTVDTVDELLAAPEVDEVVLVVGADAAAGLDTWHRPDDLRARVRVAVVDRPGAEAPPPPPGWRVDRVHVPALDVSSTDLRSRVAQGRPVAGLLPPAVVSVIRTRGLYGGRTV